MACFQLVPEMHQEVRYRQEMIKERKLFLERQQGNNSECERKGLSAKRLATKLRGELQKKQSEHARVQDGVSRPAADMSAFSTHIPR